MKAILPFLALFSAATMADSFSIVHDGVTYLCTPQNGNPSDPGGTLDCVQRAYAGPFSKQEAMELCSGANSVGPAECALRAYAGPFSKQESMQLCKRGTLANADCAIRAYAGPYSKDEALQLCRTNPALLLKSLSLTPLNMNKIMQIKDEQIRHEILSISL